MIIDPENSSFQDNHKIMIGSILPRPIAFVSTQSKDRNYNLAPFPILMVSVLILLQLCLQLVAVDMMVTQKIH